MHYPWRISLSVRAVHWCLIYQGQTDISFVCTESLRYGLFWMKTDTCIVAEVLETILSLIYMYIYDIQHLKTWDLYKFINWDITPLNKRFTPWFLDWDDHVFILEIFKEQQAKSGASDSASFSMNEVKTAVVVSYQRACRAWRFEFVC